MPDLDVICHINPLSTLVLLFHVRVALVLSPLRFPAGRTGSPAPRTPTPITADTSRCPHRRPAPEEGEEGEACKRGVSLVCIYLESFTSHLPIRPSSSSALLHQSPPNHSASKFSSCLRSPVTIDPCKHSTPLPITSTLISSALPQIDQSHQPPPDTPLQALFPPSHQRLPPVRVVA